MARKQRNHRHLIAVSAEMETQWNVWLANRGEDVGGMWEGIWSCEERARHDLGATAIMCREAEEHNQLEESAELDTERSTNDSTIGSQSSRAILRALRK